MTGDPGPGPDEIALSAPAARLRAALIVGDVTSAPAVRTAPPAR
jgi:hypothetical protein